MTAAPGLPDAFQACPADHFRSDFGACQGDRIEHVDDLLVGDIYKAKRNARWSRVEANDECHTGFALELAANLPVKTLKTIADLIFMTTTGRRFDALAAVCGGGLFVVSAQEFNPDDDYVLIDKQTREIEFVPTLVPEPATTVAQDANEDGIGNVHRLIG